VGELVLAWDATTRATSYYTVTAVMLHTDAAQVHLNVGGEHVETTPAHSFSTLERGWVAAGDLWDGAHVRRADGSYALTLVLWLDAQPQMMYNLTVATAHTFFVGVERALVHNAGCPLRSDQELFDLVRARAPKSNRSQENGVYTVLQAPDGELFYAGSNRLDRYPIRDEVMKIYQNNPCKDATAGACGEARAISIAMDKGYSLDDLVGSTIVSVFVRSNVENPKHLTLAAPCEANCSIVLPMLGIRGVDRL